MGQNNRQRRAAKRRQAGRDRRFGQRRFASMPPPSDGPGAADEQELEDLVNHAAAVAAHGRAPVLAALVETTIRRAPGDAGRARLAGVLTGLLTTAVAAAWPRGWQPADLAHVVGRRFKAGHRQVCADAIGLDAHSYRHASGADPAWLAQVDAVSGDVDPPAAQDELGEPDRTSLLDRWVLASGSVRDALTVAVETLGLLRTLPGQPRLCPPPSEWGRTARRSGVASGADPKMAERVRALLAKAESTPYPDEAEAFTAKAQELIARHAIDVAMLQGDRPSDEVVGRRVLIDDPYGRAKSMLVANIANANRCRAVFSDGLGLSTVFGLPSDLDAVELLYASLLTQATAAIAAAGRNGGAASRARSFRQSFLVAFADRIGERLEAATASAVDDARQYHGDSVLPVLASRADAAEAALGDAFPGMRTYSMTLSSREGWAAGRAAADLARLGPDTELVSSRPR